MSDIIGDSSVAVNLRADILKLSSSNATVLIQGESGTGKDLVAHALHRESRRAPYPFVKLNCAAIPQELIESELFGYDEGAFTGARKAGKKGKFEMANKGTLLLDEVSQLSLSAQAKLLRVLQEKEIERVGGSDSISVDVRIIATTNDNLDEMVQKGTFRADLYYRLNVLPIMVILFAPVFALLAAASQGLSPMPAYTELFMAKAVVYIKSFFPIFILGAVFGKIMEDTGLAKAIAYKILQQVVGKERSILSVVLAGSVLTYGGVSLFVVVFAIYPFAAAMFKEAGIPKRLIPASIVLGACTYTMDALPGTPQIQNIIPTSYFGTNVYSAPILGIIGSILI